MLRRGLVLLCICGSLLMTAGCATLPKLIPIHESEASRVRREFQTLLNDQRHCPPAMDADVSVSMDNLLWTGTLSGYLRAMAPAYLRFEGVNPLGLTEAIFAVDGQNFTYLSVREQKAYSGPLTAKLLSRYTPHGLATAMNYYWLLGRIPPGPVRIGEIGLDAEGHGYWLDLRDGTNGRWSRVLFNPGEHLVKRYLVLNEDRAAIDADLTFEYPPPRPTSAGGGQGTSGSPPALCPMPDRITISRPGNGRLELGFNKRYPLPTLDRTPFRITPPAAYQRIVVQ